MDWHHLEVAVCLLLLLITVHADYPVEKDFFIGNKNFHILFTSMTSKNASKHCQQKDMDLALIPDGTTADEMLKNIPKNFTFKSFWLKRSDHQQIYSGKNCFKYSPKNKYRQWIADCSKPAFPICAKRDVAKCQEPDQLEFGMISKSNGNQVGSQLEYTCFEDYELQGAATRECDKYGTWSGGKPACSPRLCEELRDIDNGYVQTTKGNWVGSEAKFSCHAEHEIVGATSAKCQKNRMWSESAPTCKALPKCIEPRHFDYGYMKMTNGTFVGSKIEFFCDKFYKLEGKQVIECQSNKAWSQDNPTCTPIECEDLPTLTNGYIDLTDGQLIDSTANFRCHQGYRLVGQSRAVCQGNGRWTKNSPRCEAIKCPELDSLKNGYTERSRENWVGSKAKFSCHYGYKMRGNSEATCGSNEKWLSDMPTCELLSCPSPKKLKNGYTERSNGNLIGSVASFFCHASYRLIGEKKAQCKENEEWSNDVPWCKLIECPSLGTIKNGFIGKSEGNRIGSRALFSCHFGFQLIGAQDSVCRSNSRWSNKIPQCREITCPNLFPPENGFVHKSKGNSLGSEVVFGCLKGYRMIGRENSECKINEKWSWPKPTCKLIECPELDNLENGRKERSKGNLLGSTVEYWCNQGYKRIGASSAECQDNDQWSHYPPTCQRKECPDIEPIQKGSVNKTDGNFYKSKAQFLCESGYKIVGSEVMECQENEMWSEEIPFCEKILCPTFPTLKNGFVRKSKGNSIGSIARSTCFEGYHMFGESVSICEKSKEWTNPAPTCGKCSNELQEVKACKRPILGEEVTLTCSGIACSDVTEEDVRWVADTGSYTGLASNGHQLIHPEKKYMKLHREFKNGMWTYNLTLNVYDEYMAGRYSCGLKDNSSAVNIKPIDKNDWGSVSCSGREINVKSYKKASYVRVGGEEGVVVALTRRGVGRLPDSYEQRRTYQLQVCFCDSIYYPTGCVSVDTYCG